MYCFPEKTSSRIWTQISVSISFDKNHDTTNASMRHGWLLTHFFLHEYFLPKKFSYLPRSSLLNLYFLSSLLLFYFFYYFCISHLLFFLHQPSSNIFILIIISNFLLFYSLISFFLRTAARILSFSSSFVFLSFHSLSLSLSLSLLSLSLSLSNLPVSKMNYSVLIYPLILYVLFFVDSFLLNFTSITSPNFSKHEIRSDLLLMAFYQVPNFRKQFSFDSHRPTW